MRGALYCPKLGYYEQAGGRIGRVGDFYTSVSTGSLFGELLAFRFGQWLDELPPGPVQLVEAGAHDGRLAADILDWIGRKRPALLERMEYWLVEPSAQRQSWQREKLGKASRAVRWFNSFTALPSSGVHGVIFANELLDALPVRRLGWDAVAGCWFEWGVRLHGDDFAWARLSAGDLSGDFQSAGIILPAELLAVLPDGFTVDLGPEAADWWRAAALVLRRGKLITLDYGLTAGEFLAPARGKGTLRAYHRHHLETNPLARAGEQDLTAHVNFTHLQKVGEAAGLCTDGLLSQTRFLTHIAEQTWQPASGFGEWTSAHVRQFQTLTHPDHLGRAFQVLVQSSGS